MRSILLTMFSTIILSSCLTPSKIDKICRNRPHTDSVVTVIKKERYDSLIYVSSPPDTVKVASPCDSAGNLKQFDIVSKHNGINIEVKSVGNNIVATAQADSIPDNVKGLNTKEQTDTVQTKTIITNDCPETWLQVLYRKGFIIYSILTVLGIIIFSIRLAIKIK